MRPEDGSSKGGGIEITVERRGVAAGTHWTAILGELARRRNGTIQSAKSAAKGAGHEHQSVHFYTMAIARRLSNSTNALSAAKFS